MIWFIIAMTLQVGDDNNYRAEASYDDVVECRLAIDWWRAIPTVTVLDEPEPCSAKFSPDLRPSP
jgi:hypothetical protein